MPSRLLLARNMVRASHARTFPLPLSHRHRSLNTESAPSLYAARVTVIGARTGQVKGESLSLSLAMSKALGGSGDKDKTNPEELFAAGYGACFQSAMNAVAPTLGVKMPSNPDDSVVESTVHLVGSMQELDMGLRVELRVRVRGLDKDKLEEVVREARRICPYSRATEGNVATSVVVESM